MICAPGFRARAYAQRLASAGLAPECAIFLAGAEPEWDGPEVVSFQVGESRVVFRPGLPAPASMADSRCTALAASDVNGDEAARAIGEAPVNVLVYAGAGGVILSPRILATGKRFLHVHGGLAPRFRGSTAFYYSLLEEGTIGATAIWLDEGIDTGPVVARMQVPSPEAVEIDRVFDPCLRAELLASVLRRYRETGAFPEKHAPPDEAATTYFVIHPVLKHLALRRCDLVRQG